MPASSASSLPSFSRRKRASSRCCVLAAWTSAAFPSASSATAVSEPERRRRSRAARRASLREAVRGEGEHRHHEQRCERQPPREQEQRAAEEQDPRGGLHELAGGRQQQRLDRVDVAGQAGEHVAVAAAVERVGLEPLQVGEELRAQGEREALADPGRRVLVAEREQRPEQREADHRRHEDRERRERLGHQHVVDHDLEQPDLGGLDGRQQRRERDPGRELLAVRPRQRPEAAEDVADRHGGRGGDDAGVVGGRGESGGEAVEEGAQEWKRGQTPRGRLTPF